MILFEDHTIIIGFEPAYNLLSVQWLPVEHIAMFEFQNSFHQILKLIDDNQVRNLYIDCAIAVKDLPAAAFQAMSEFLIGGIASNTHLQKLARIEMLRPEFEAFTLKTIAAFREILGFTIEERAFQSQEAALAWLKGGSF